MPVQLAGILREESFGLHKSFSKDLISDEDPQEFSPEDKDLADQTSYELLIIAITLLPYFMPVLDRTIERAQNGLPIGTRAVEAWRVVHAAAVLCQNIERNNGKSIKVPKKMGPSGPFYRLLLDLLEVFDLKEQPEHIFNTWSAHVGWSGTKKV